MRDGKTLGEGELLERSSPSPKPTPSQELSHHATSNVKTDFALSVGGCVVGISFFGWVLVFK